MPLIDIDDGLTIATTTAVGGGGKSVSNDNNDSNGHSTAKRIPLEFTCHGCKAARVKCEKMMPCQR